MNKLIIFILLVFTISNSNKVMAQQKESVSRKDLMTAILTEQKVSKVDIKEVTIPAGCVTGYHLHPCPVVGYIISGTVLFQEEGKEPQTLKAGSAFYEPKDKPIVHFDNMLTTEPLVFVAMYLREANEDIIKMLHE